MIALPPIALISLVLMGVVLGVLGFLELLRATGHNGVSAPCVTCGKPTRGVMYGGAVDMRITCSHDCYIRFCDMQDREDEMHAQQIDLEILGAYEAGMRAAKREQQDGAA